MQNKFLLHQQLLMFVRLDSPEMDFGGFNSAEKTPPTPSFLPALNISSPCRILVRNPSAPAPFF